MSWFGLMPIVLQNSTPPETGPLGLPVVIWVLAIGAAGFQLLAYIRRRRK